jgi:hypothetical protein
MKFFIPNTKPSEAEATHADMIATLKDTFGFPITERRIQSLDYFNSKKKWHAEVGKLEQQEHRYEILAIFESKSYIIVTGTVGGGSGLTILVDRDEVTEAVDFDPVPVTV